MFPCLQVCAELNKAIRGVMSGYLVGLTVKGVGYRMEPADEALAQVGGGEEGWGALGLSLTVQSKIVAVLRSILPLLVSTRVWLGPPGMEVIGLQELPMPSSFTF